MAFTPDALPAVGFVRPGIILAADFQTAPEFLAALNQGLIAALRGADQRLLRLSATGPGAAYAV